MPPQNPIDRFAYSRDGTGTDERCLIRVNIPGVTTATQHTRYKIDVMNLQTRQTWQTSHRYSEFLKLRNDLLATFSKADKKCPGCLNFEKSLHRFEFPSKRLFTSKNIMVINYRKKALRAFLSLLASNTFTASPKCPTCSGFPFVSVRDFLTEELEATPGTASPTGSALERESIRESINVKEFMTYVPVPVMKPVNSEGVFIREGSLTASERSHASSASAKSSPSQNSKAPKDLPSPASIAGTTSLPPPSPQEPVQAEVQGESFVSFSEQEDGKPAPKLKNRAPTPRAPSSKRRQSKKSKRGSSRPVVATQASVKTSVAEDVGSLNMDFLNTLAINDE